MAHHITNNNILLNIYYTCISICILYICIHLVEAWQCKDLRTEAVGHVTRYYSVLYNAARRQYECRQYTPVPPGVMLVKRRATPGGKVSALVPCLRVRVIYLQCRYWYLYYV